MGGTEDAESGKSAGKADVGGTEIEPDAEAPVWQKALSIAIGTIISSIIYLVFMLTVLYQSTTSGVPVNPNEWRVEVESRSWIVGLCIFLGLFVFPFSLLGVQSKPSSGWTPLVDGYSGWLYAFIGVLLMIQLATIYYAYLRPELRKVRKLDARFRYGRCFKGACGCHRGFWRRDGRGIRRRGGTGGKQQAAGEKPRADGQPATSNECDALTATLKQKALEGQPNPPPALPVGRHEASAAVPYVDDTAGSRRFLIGRIPGQSPASATNSPPYRSSDSSGSYGAPCDDPIGQDARTVSGAAGGRSAPSDWSSQSRLLLKSSRHLFQYTSGSESDKDADEKMPQKKRPGPNRRETQPRNSRRQLRRQARSASNVLVALTAASKTDDQAYTPKVHQYREAAPTSLPALRSPDSGRSTATVPADDTASGAKRDHSGIIPAPPDSSNLHYIAAHATHGTSDGANSRISDDASSDSEDEDLPDEGGGSSVESSHRSSPMRASTRAGARRDSAAIFKLQRTENPLLAQAGAGTNEGHECKEYPSTARDRPQQTSRRPRKSIFDLKGGSFLVLGGDPSTRRVDIYKQPDAGVPPVAPCCPVSVGASVEDAPHSQGNTSRVDKSGKRKPPRWVELRYADGSTPCMVCPCSLALWRNWLMIGIAGLELLQLTSLGLNCAPELLDSLGETLPPELLELPRKAADVFFQLGGGGDGDPTFVPFVGSVAFSGMYVIISGLFIALDLGLDSFVAPLLFSLFAGGFYVTVTATLLFVIANTERRAEAIASAVCLLYYSSTAVFMSIYRGDGGAMGSHVAAQVSTIPLFLAVERVLKGVLSSVYVLIEDDLARSAAVVAILTLHLGVMVSQRPVSKASMSAIRIGTGMVGWWAAVVGLVSVVGEGSVSAMTLAGTLVAGWVVVVLSVVAWLGVSCGHTRDVFLPLPL